MSADEDRGASAGEAQTTLGDRLGRLVDRVAEAPLAHGAPDEAAEQGDAGDPSSLDSIHR